MSAFDFFRREPSIDRFAQSILDGLRAAGDRGNHTYDRTNQLIQREDGGKINLQRMFADHCEVPAAERANHMRRIVQAVLPPPPLPTDFEDAVHDLRPRIWSREQLTVAGHLPPHQLVGEHLVATIAYDMPSSVRAVGADGLENWGVTYGHTHAVACQQLSQDECKIAAAGDSLFCFANDDAYDASRLFMLDVIRQLPVNGTPVAFAPSRDQLLITGIDDVDGVKMAVQIANETHEKTTRPLCPLPLRLDEDQWVEWMPEPEHPHYQLFRETEMHFLGGLYERQRQRMNEQQDDKFVAKFSAFKKDGELLSFCTWSKTVATNMPRTQYIIFYDPDTEAVVANGTWGAVQDVVGDLLQPTKDYPVRYYVEEFPNRDQLAAIGKELELSD